MSQLPPARVFKGLWIDYAHGDVLGATMTTDSNTSTVVVAVVSILIAFAGSHLWDIVAYLFFATSATVSNRGKLHHQQQFLLRNIASPAAFLVKSVGLHRQWYGSSRDWKSGTRLAALAVTAAFCSIGFLAAGIASSQIVSTTSIDVLAQSPSCGFTDQSITTTISNASYAYKAIQDSVRYAHECYNASESNPACHIYQTKSIPFNTTYDVCPFQNLCTLKSDQALKMDTGLLWSDSVFGINTQRSSALAIRQVTTCAPLNLDEYTEVAPMDEAHSEAGPLRKPLPGEIMTNLKIGPWPGLPFNDTITRTSVLTQTLSSYTFGIAFWWSAALERFQESPWWPGWCFDPISPLRSTEGDLTVITVNANRLRYDSPVDDPFFAAHGVGTYETELQENRTLYSADESGGKMGCTQQIQFCTRKEQCTNLTYIMSAGSQAVHLGLDPMQNVTLYAYMNALVNCNVGFSEIVAGDLPLLAKDGATRGEAPGLPPNQWELEVKYWTAIILATMQKVVAGVAAGQGISGERFEHQVNLPPGPYESVFCHAQKMKAPDGISNINVFALSFTVSLCGFIVLTNLTLPILLRWISVHRKRGWTFVRQWDEEELLEFRKTAFASRDSGATSNSTESINLAVGDKGSVVPVPANTTATHNVKAVVEEK